jgi:hypothetical protein
MVTKLTALQRKDINIPRKDIKMYAGGDQRATPSQVAALKTQAATNAKNIAEGKAAAQAQAMKDRQQQAAINAANKKNMVGQTKMVAQNKPVGPNTSQVAAMVKQKTTNDRNRLLANQKPLYGTNQKPLYGTNMAKGGVAASKMGAVKTASPSRDGVAVKGKTVGKNLGDSGKNVGIMRGARRTK